MLVGLLLRPRLYYSFLLSSPVFLSLGNPLLLKDLLPLCFLLFLHLLCQSHSAPCCQLAPIHCSVFDLISTEGIALSLLCRLPELGPQAFCALVYRSMNCLFGHQSCFFFDPAGKRRFFLDLLDGISPQVGGLRGHHTVELGVLREAVHKGHDGAAALHQSPSKVHVGDVGKLVVRDIQQPG